jgi:hypothetical protein
MDKSSLRVVSPLVLAAMALLLVACGNKGPLTMVSEPPPVVPMAAEAPVPADELEGTLPDTTPPEQPAATDVVVPPPSDAIDENESPPPPTTPTDDGAG